MEKGVILPDRISPEFLICTAYLTASKKGYDSISLKQDKLDDQITRISNVLTVLGFDAGELFLKVPSFKNYINYIAFLIRDLCNTGLASYDTTSKTIKIDCDYMDIWRSNAWALGLIGYERVVNELCYAITQDKTFIGNRCCGNCGYGCYPTENLRCDLYEEVVDEGGYCCNHAFSACACYGDGTYDMVLDIGCFEESDYDKRIGELRNIQDINQLRKYKKPRN